MDYWGETNWFVVQTKPRQQTLAATWVANLDFQVFLPKIRRELCVCGPRLVTKPLFSGCFFARLSPVRSLGAVPYARGVLRVDGMSQCPIPVESDIICSIQDRVQADGFTFQNATAVCRREGEHRARPFRRLGRPSRTGVGRWPARGHPVGSNPTRPRGDSKALPGVRR